MTTSDNSQAWPDLKPTALLVLADGTVLEGFGLGAEGQAVGEVAGNALRWRYHLNLPVDDNTYVVYFDDWMYLMDDDTLINRSSMSKFGIELGQVTLFFRRATATP